MRADTLSAWEEEQIYDYEEEAIWDYSEDNLPT